MIDNGELDWKIIVLCSDDPMAPRLKDVVDLEAEMPHIVQGIREWFRWYKAPDGKPLNSFGFDEKALNKAQTLEIIAETHEAWKELMSGKRELGKLWIE